MIPAPCTGEFTIGAPWTIVNPSSVVERVSPVANRTVGARERPSRVVTGRPFGAPDRDRLAMEVQVLSIDAGRDEQRVTCSSRVDRRLDRRNLRGNMKGALRLCRAEHEDENKLGYTQWAAND